MAELIDVANAMFRDRNKWESINDEDKIKYFFIINRYLSKKYIHLSSLLNDKSIDKVSAMNTWFLFMKSQPYPKWFWSKSPKEKKEISDSDINMIIGEYSINREDLIFLINNYYDVIIDELKYLKSKK